MGGVSKSTGPLLSRLCVFIQSLEKSCFVGETALFQVSTFVEVSWAEWIWDGQTKADKPGTKAEEQHLFSEQRPNVCVFSSVFLFSAHMGFAGGPPKMAASLVNSL